MNTTTNDLEAGIRRRRGMIIASALLLIFGAGALWVHLAADEPASPTHHVASESPVSGIRTKGTQHRRKLEQTLPQTTGYYSAPVGSEFIYALDLDILAQTSSKQEQVEAGFKLKGELRLVVLSRTNDHVIISWSCQGLSLDSRIKETKETDYKRSEILRLLSHPTIVKMNPDGQVLGYKFHEGTSHEGQGWIRSMVSGLRFVARKTSTPYLVAEGDSTGTAEVQYNWLAPDRLRKTKVRYSELAGGTQDTEIQLEVQSQGEATFSTELRFIQDASYGEQIRFALPVHSVTFVISFDAKMRLLDHTLLVTTSLPIIDDNDWNPVTVAPSSESSDARDEAALRQRLQEISFSDILINIQNLLAEGDISSQGIFEASTLLAHMLRLRPETVDQLRSSIHNLETDPTLVNVLLAAAGASQGNEAQTLLRDIVGDLRRTEDTRLSATLSMFQLEQPREDLIRLVTKRSQAGSGSTLIDSSSQLLLGKLAGSGTTEASKAALQSLYEMELTAKRNGNVDTWLLALANSGNPAALAKAEPYLSDGRSSTRLAAVKVVSKNQSQRAQDLLMTSSTDANVEVRIAAINGLAAYAKKTAVIEFLRNLSKHEENETVGNAISSIIG